MRGAAACDPLPPSGPMPDREVRRLCTPTHAVVRSIAMYGTALTDVPARRIVGPMSATAHSLPHASAETAWSSVKDANPFRARGLLIEAKPAAAENRLLAALTDRSREAFLASCDHVALRTAEVLCRSGEQIRYVYFPLDCCLLQMAGFDGGERLEVGMVGDEGMLGVSLILGVNVWPQLALVQGSGTALRMGAALFRRHCRESLGLRQEMQRYAYVLMSQLARSITCTHYHVVEARLARWLLMTRDRAHANQIRLTHEALSELLGVRRAGVTRAASSLRRRKLIRYTRGHITILDQHGLEAAACGCYAADKKTYSNALGYAA
jgi:CRP-like cAMP-binding protein